MRGCAGHGASRALASFPTRYDVHKRQDFIIAALVFCNMLSGTVLIPVVRPFFAMFHPGNEPAMHAFFSANMLGAVVGAPAFALWADRTGQRRRLAGALALADGVLLALCAVKMPIGLLLGIRTLQGAASVGALSLLMGYSPRHASSKGHGGAVGLQGGALVTAIAAGAPLGTLLIRLGPRAPFHGAALLALLVAGASLWLLSDQGTTRAARGSARALLKNSVLLRLPALWIGVERFTVGCFVVTFSLYAHRVLGLSDARVGMLFSCFLVPFALVTWPVAVLASHFDRGLLLAAGALVYGVCFLLLGEVSVAVLPGVLGLAGVASATIYGPSLCLVAAVAPPSLRATAMGLANAAGTLGMLAGTATAGILSVVLLDHGVARGDIYVALFRIAGGAELALLAVSLPVLVATSRGPAPPLEQVGDP